MDEKVIAIFLIFIEVIFILLYVIREYNLSQAKIKKRSIGEMYRTGMLCKDDILEIRSKSNISKSTNESLDGEEYLNSNTSIDNSDSLLLVSQTILLTNAAD
ncbi:hypothetical protein [Chryseobacterium arthrosphaerae]|uniref:hypothetical protein n=1 Tax=Chryseobacterium arthrosphaerae TaxID=651561 RepID=UPI0031DEA43E